MLIIENGFFFFFGKIVNENEKFVCICSPLSSSDDTCKTDDFFLTVDNSFLIQVYTIRIIFRLNGNVLAFDMFGCLLCFGQPVQFIHLFTLHTFGTYYLRNLLIM